ncbi:MAG: helix-turn-helix domain-containing protein [Desulfotomaculaceae bacterium]|nr:helix-turn-helix domain-containing protein [Desulfotomaculaceae bacterium]
MDLSGKNMSAAEVGEILGITPSSVRRLVREGVLEVKETKRYKAGEELYFDSSAVKDLLPRMPELRRKWHSEENRRLGARKAAFKRVDDAGKALRHTGIKKKFLFSLEFYPEKAALLLRASFFLYHLNHYAKGGEEYLYDLKEKVLKKFVSDFSAVEGLDIVFIEGGQKVLLCAGCRVKAQSMGLSYLKYKINHGGCPQCRKEEDYYSLFEFRVVYGEHRFCFHTPYYIARKWFENMAELPKKVREKGKEEALPFGRPISEGEARAVTLEEVIRELKSFLGD